MIRLLLATALAGCLLTGLPSEANASTTCVPVRGASFKSTPWKYRHADTWLYGDSITYQTYRDLRPSIRDGLATDALWGRRTVSAVTALGKDVHRYWERLPSTVVIATGTNDMTDLATFTKQVRLARAVLPARVRLLWVNVYVETTPMWNAADRILSEQPGIRVLRWSAVNLTATVPLLADGIHVNSLGCAARNRLIATAVNR